MAKEEKNVVSIVLDPNEKSLDRERFKGTLIAVAQLLHERPEVDKVVLHLPGKGKDKGTHIAWKLK